MAADPNHVKANQAKVQLTPAQQRNKLTPQQEREENDADLRARFDSFKTARDKTARDLAVNRKKQGAEDLQKVLQASISSVPNADADLQKAIAESAALAKAQEALDRAARAARAAFVQDRAPSQAQPKQEDSVTITISKAAAAASGAGILWNVGVDRKRDADRAVPATPVKNVAKGSPEIAVRPFLGPHCDKKYLADTVGEPAALQPQVTPILSQFNLTQDSLLQQEQLKKDREKAKQEQLRNDMEEARKTANARKSAESAKSIATATAMANRKKNMVIKNGVITYV